MHVRLCISKDASAEAIRALAGGDREVFGEAGNRHREWEPVGMELVRMLMVEDVMGSIEGKEAKADYLKCSSPLQFS